MKKIFAALLITASALTFNAYAKEAEVGLPKFNVSFNGTNVESSNRQFPLIVYNDITYVPMTYYDCRYLGLTTMWENETRTLYIEKNDITCAYRDYAWQWENAESFNSGICDFNIVINQTNIDNSQEEYPLLTYRDVTYLPLTWKIAAEEFGWDYLFDAAEGLSIISDNYHLETVALPYLSTEKVATDGKYYYYNGNSGEKRVVYRALASDTSKAEIIYELEDTPISFAAYFMEENGSIYFYYNLGGSLITGTRKCFKINSDGTVVEEEPKTYSFGKHGRSDLSMENEGIFVKATNKYFDSQTDFSYEKDGKTTEVPALPGRVRVGWLRNGKSLTFSVNDCIQIFNEKIYYTAVDLDNDEMKDSALYVIDTKKGTSEKLIDGVCGFYVFNGWDNASNKDSTMIIFDNNGKLMRYIENTGAVNEVDGVAEENTFLQVASGGYMIYTVQKTIAGDRTVVKEFDCYGARGGSVKRVLLDTTIGTNCQKKSNIFCLSVCGESANEDVRIFVLGYDKNGQPRFCSSDVAYSMLYNADMPFISEEFLTYRLGDGTAVKVDLKK